MSLTVIVSSILLMSCNIIEPEHDPITYGETYVSNMLSTDKACYQPGDVVQLSMPGIPEGEVTVRYQHLGKTIKEEPVTSRQWTWQPPSQDFQGYMAEIHGKVNGRDTVYSSVGIDVSSEPARFPRNGFLSMYGKMSASEIAAVMDDLNRYHINYVQFQDWHWKHHHPLGGSVTQPMEVWTDIISRNCYRATVQGYIDAAHARGMKTLFYNLLYGALDDCVNDGVSKEWMVFKDKNHGVHDTHPLSSPFKSSIYVLDPNNQNWKEYLSARNDEVYQVFNFDGWQIDQLGYRGSVYDYKGQEIEMDKSFGQFVTYMKDKQPTKRLVMNAVGQYGQEGQIATAPVDFCYTEVWSHNNSNGYTIFSNIITDNAKWSNGKQTVLAAYLNYNHGRKGRGWFNTPGIIMGTAAAMAWGGTILQMGEHMLNNEYFPNSNLSMSGDLKRAMISYYDFTVAYENLLRPDVPASGVNSDWYGVDVTSETVAFNQWAPQKGQIATIGRHVDNRDVVQLLSYRNATHLDWCDTDANQGEPDWLYNISIAVSASEQPTRVWFASPDYNHGAAMNMEFSYANGQVQLTLPAIKYYSMIVLEY